MDLAVLNSSFKRERLIENWNSLVWTERYSKNGDFQLVSYHISDVLNMLPLGGPLDPPTVVSIGDSTVPMVVEDHKIEKNKTGIAQVTTTGRSFETVLDRRVTVKKDGGSPPKRVKDVRIAAVSAATAAYEIIKDIVVDGEVSSLDIIPEITLVNSVADSNPSEEFPVEPKDLYAWAIETLVRGKYGLRAELSALSTIGLVIYKGTDRSSGTASVTFDVALDQFDKASYLLTKAGYKNLMIVSALNRLEFVDITGVAPSGLARRVAFTNLETEVTIANGAPLQAFLINKGKVALSDLLPTQLFSGGVSQSIGESYNDKYFLGDIVKLQGDYGLSQNARIAEFVRTHDTTGEKAYPTFEAITP